LVIKLYPLKRAKVMPQLKVEKLKKVKVMPQLKRKNCRSYSKRLPYETGV
jgi:hypothetical protein